ncbi:MAG TPA: alpha/beta hydrolase-fold protein [Candidatus Acidoferrales bacterium]|nr:alpha/beta hydrolase-fold protein [Candidatus Acidoferrales bacterium]
MLSTVTLHDISSPHLPMPVPYALLAPSREEPLPLCILLLGAGGTRDSMFDLQPLFEAWWAESTVSPMIIAAPTAGLDYYMEEPAGPIRWDSFLAGDFVPHLRSTCNVSDSTVIAGISGGGYGALKAAFARPNLFAAVAAMQPMLEPGLRESDVGPRNRLHHSAGGPPQLIGPARDPAIWESNNPANRARSNAQHLRDSGLAIYLEAGDKDFLNAHDGAEFLHRVLWDLDLSHEYHLVRGADHGGPTMRPRLGAMFAWFGSLWNPAPLDAAAEQAATVWLQSGMQGKPPAGATATNVFVRFLRAGFEPLRARAAESDPTTNRNFGQL